MKRSLPVIGLVCFLFLVPFLLHEFMGGPYVPHVNVGEIKETLSGPFLSADAVIRGLGLITWVLWCYLVIVVLLRSVAVIALQRGSPSGKRLIALTSVMGPAILLRCVDVALGAILLIGPVASGKVEASRSVSAAPVTPVTVLASGNGSHSQAAVQRSYVVRPGDSLWRIAEKELGSGDRWREIVALNEGRSFPDGRTLRNRRLIRPNWILWLPGLEASAQIQPPEAEIYVPSQPALPSPIANTDHPQVSSEEPASQEDLDEQVAQEEDETARRPVISLPSGVAVAASFASGVLASQAFARLRRRRRYRPLVDSPEPPREPQLVDELQLGRTDSAIVRAARVLSNEWRGQTGSIPQMVWALEDEDRVVALVRAPEEEVRPSDNIIFSRDGDYVRAEIRGLLAEFTMDRGSIFEEGPLVAIARSLGSAHHLGPVGSGLVSLTGSNAEELARSLILGMCAGHRPDDIGVYLAGNFDSTYADIPHVRGSGDWPDSANVLHEVQSETLARARVFTDEGVADIWKHAARPEAQDMPAILIAATEPPPGLRGAIEGIASQCSAHGLSFVAVGWTPTATSVTLSVEADLQIESPFGLPNEDLEPLLLNDGETQQVMSILRDAYSTDSIRVSVDEMSTPLPLTPSAVYPPIEEPAKYRVTVECLGQMIVKKDGEDVVEWRARSKELLAYLVALRKGVPEEKLLSELWPNAQKPKRMLRDAIFRLRSIAYEESDKYSERFVLRDEGTIRLEPGIWGVDAWRFEDLIASSEALSADDAVRCVREALGLYRSEFCDGSDFVWIPRFRERFRRLMASASVRLSELLKDRDMLHESLAVIDEAIQGDVYCEDLHRRAMGLEIALGRGHAAEERYQKLVTLLAEDLGEEPEEATQTVVASILSTIPR